MEASTATATKYRYDSNKGDVSHRSSSTTTATTTTTSTSVTAQIPSAAAIRRKKKAQQIQREMAKIEQEERNKTTTKEQRDRDRDRKSSSSSRTKSSGATSTSTSQQTRRHRSGTNDGTSTSEKRGEKDRHHHHHSETIQAVKRRSSTDERDLRKVQQHFTKQRESRRTSSSSAEIRQAQKELRESSKSSSKKDRHHRQSSRESSSASTSHHHHKSSSSSSSKVKRRSSKDDDEQQTEQQQKLPGMTSHTERPSVSSRSKQMDKETTKEQQRAITSTSDRKERRSLHQSQEQKGKPKASMEIPEIPAFRKKSTRPTNNNNNNTQIVEGAESHSNTNNEKEMQSHKLVIPEIPPFKPRNSNKTSSNSGTTMNGGNGAGKKDLEAYSTLLKQQKKISEKLAERRGSAGWSDCSSTSDGDDDVGEKKQLPQQLIQDNVHNGGYYNGRSNSKAATTSEQIRQRYLGSRGAVDDKQNNNDGGGGFETDRSLGQHGDENIRNSGRNDTRHENDHDHDDSDNNTWKSSDSEKEEHNQSMKKNSNERRNKKVVDNDNNDDDYGEIVYEYEHDDGRWEDDKEAPLKNNAKEKNDIKAETRSKNSNKEYQFFQKEQLPSSFDDSRWEKQQQNGPANTGTNPWEKYLHEDDSNKDIFDAGATSNKKNINAVVNSKHEKEPSSSGNNKRHHAISKEISREHMDAYKHGLSTKSQNSRQVEPVLKRKTGEPMTFTKYEVDQKSVSFGAGKTKESSDIKEEVRIFSQDEKPIDAKNDTTDAAYAIDSDQIEKVTAINYVGEHRIFLKAILELLSQRDKHTGMEVDMNDPYTIKSGPLKKSAHGVRGWKVKYVEIRRGLFSYYEDAASKDEPNELLRKNVPLQANLCTCRAVKVQHNALSSPGGAIFELNVEGRPKKLWMANTREERQAWISAIQDAMVGGSVTRGQCQIDHHGGRNRLGISSRSPYKKDLETYLKVQSTLRSAVNKSWYAGALSELVGQSLNVPVQWIMAHTEKLTDHNAENVFHEETTCVGVNQLWKDLLRDSVRINGELFRGDCGHAPERIVGALTRSIIMFDRKEEHDNANGGANAPGASLSRFHVTESQALSYARDVLLAGNRTRTGGDSYYCVDTLCKNNELAVLCPSTTEAEPLKITVERLDPEQEQRAQSKRIEYSMNDLSGWLKTRSKSQKPWKKRYFVLCEGTLSYYEKAKPRPHGLRGQLVLSHASINVFEENKQVKNSNDSSNTGRRLMIGLNMNDGSKDRQICFDDYDKFVLWAHALDNVIGLSGKGKKSVLGKFRRGSHDKSKGPAASLGLDDLEERAVALAKAKSTKAPHSVKISIQASTEYKICTTDPQGVESEDTWATICAKFLQSFRLAGGPNGRLTKGEELVQITVVECQNPRTRQSVPSRVRRSASDTSAPLSRARFDVPSLSHKR